MPYAKPCGLTASDSSSHSHKTAVFFRLPSGWISAVSLACLMLRKANGSSLAKKQLAALTQLIECMDVQKADVINALSSEMADYEDAVLDAAASRIKADYIITRNEKDFTHSRVPALSPAAFLQLPYPA